MRPDKLLSVYDGCTEYNVGRWTLAKRGVAAAWPPLHACFFAHSSPDEARLARFPKDSRTLSAARVLIQVRTLQCAASNFLRGL